MMLAFPPLPTQGYPSAWDVSLLPSLWLFGLAVVFLSGKNCVSEREGEGRDSVEGRRATCCWPVES